MQSVFTQLLIYKASIRDHQPTAQLKDAMQSIDARTALTRASNSCFVPARQKCMHLCSVKGSDFHR